MCSTPPAMTTSYGAEADARRGGGHGGHRAGAHAVDGEAGHGFGQPGEDRGGAADRQALVADLGGRRDGDLVDAGGIELGVAAQQLPDDLDDEVVGAGLGVHALRARLAERGADAVDEDDVALVRGGGSHAFSSRWSGVLADTFRGEAMRTGYQGVTGLGTTLHPHYR